MALAVITPSSARTDDQSANEWIAGLFILVCTVIAVLLAVGLLSAAAPATTDTTRPGIGAPAVGDPAPSPKIVSTELRAQRQRATAPSTTG
ncbi:MAG: hypothetical protein IPO93_06875 [Actinobacteria bacterium]|jgi:hypothetical protein|nr:hypothetical protein [Actinomycetota bacterium]